MRMTRTRPAVFRRGEAVAVRCVTAGGPVDDTAEVVRLVDYAPCGAAGDLIGQYLIRLDGSDKLLVVPGDTLTRVDG